MTYLLDTHVLLWWFEEDPELPKSFGRILSRVTPEAPLGVSDISLWEIATLYGLERIHLTLPLRDWLERATAPPLVQRIGISPAIAAEMNRLPDDFHRDPADRIIVSTARVLGATLLTRDRRILEARIVKTLE